MKLLDEDNAGVSFINQHVRPCHGMKILDLGCGPATILKYLPRSISYVGIDISRRYIDSAKLKFSDRGSFYCLPLELLSEKFKNAFDLVLGLGLLHHLDDDQANLFFNIASEALRTEGRCLTIDPCIVTGQPIFARLMIKMDRGQNIRLPLEYKELVGTTFEKVVQTVSHDKLRIPYTHHIMECWKG
jgi:SAM-dependent methyltransferase